MQKLKQKLLLLALLGASTGGLVLSVIKPTLAVSAFDIWNAIASPFVLLFDIIVNILNFILGILAGFVTLIGQLLLSAAFNTDPNFLLNSATTGAVWNKILMLTNGIYLLILVIASIAIILRVNVGVYNVKKILGGLVTAVALSNLSLLIVKALVEFGGQITTSLTQLFNINSEGYKKFLMDLLNETQPIKYVVEGASGMSIIVGWIAFILIAMIILKLAVILLERMIWIFGLTVVAPLAFAVSVLPNMQSYSKQWWEYLIKWIMVLPVTIGLICLAIFVMTSGKFNSNSGSDISKTIVGLTQAGFFQENSSGFISISSDLLVIIAGLAILWVAGEASKRMKLGAVTGTVYKGVSKGISDTLAGKNAIGKFGKDKYYEEVYPRLMQNERLAGWEGKRQTVTKGAWGYLFNKKGMLAKRKADTEITAKEAAASAQAKKVSDLGAKLKKRRADLDATHGGWLDESGEPKENAPANVKNAYTQYIKEKKEFEAERGALRKFHIKNVNKDYTPETIPTFEELEEKFNKAISRKDAGGKEDIDYGEANAAMDLILRLSRARNIRPEDARKASEFLDKSSTGDVVENKLYLNPKEFRSRLTIEKRLKGMKVAESDTEELLVKTDLEIDQNKTQLDNLKATYGIGALVDQKNKTINREKLIKLKNIDNRVNTLGQPLSPSQKTIAWQRIITARNTVKPEDANNPAKINNQLFADPSFDLDKLTQPEVEYYGNIIELLTTTDKNDVDTYINIKNTASTKGKTLAQVITDVEALNEKNAQLEIKKAELDNTLETDNRTHRPAYELIVRNDIKRRMRTPGVSSYNAKIATQTDLNEIQQVTTEALKTNPHNKTLKEASPDNFEQITSKYKAMGLPHVSDQELEGKTIGEFAADVRRARSALNKIDQPIKTEKKKSK